MSGLKQLRSRIKSVKTTQKITKAMQLVSAAKFTKAKNQVKNAEEYIQVLNNLIANLVTRNNLKDMKEEDKKFFIENSNKPHLLIVITAERGLCGPFNSLILKQLKADIIKLEKEEKQVKLIIIGKKGYNSLKKGYLSYIDSYFDFQKSSNKEWQFNLQEKLMNMIVNMEIGNCQIYFGKCKNAMVQIPTKQQIFPLTKQLTIQQDQYVSYEYEGEDLVFNIANLYIKAEINYALLHSKASEEGARMTAMDNATRNASGLLDNLTLKLNKSRQDIITKDLIEIIAGVEALYSIIKFS